MLRRRRSAGQISRTHNALESPTPHAWGFQPEVAGLRVGGSGGVRSDGVCGFRKLGASGSGEMHARATPGALT